MQERRFLSVRQRHSHRQALVQEDSGDSGVSSSEDLEASVSADAGMSVSRGFRNILQG